MTSGAPRPTILLIGANGQLGWELARTLAPLGRVVAPTRAQLDLADGTRVRAAVRDVRPQIVVNAAAYTAVDQAEREAAMAHAVNGVAPGILAEEAARLRALIVHYSTDYVFDGTTRTPYTERDEPNPLNVYGETKLAGERAIAATGAAHLIFRTAWVYGLRRQNFLRSILGLAHERTELRVVEDQVGAPTWSRMIAEGTALALAHVVPRGGAEADAPWSGLYHLTAAGQASRFELAKAILERDPR
ncbi:MAG: dTDP-4-dehydrorhamnose reductase, partial [Gemmatimonadaceae bacterium]